MGSHNFWISISIVKLEMTIFAVLQCISVEIEVPIIDMSSKVDGAKINNPLKYCTINTYRLQSMVTTFNNILPCQVLLLIKALNPYKFCIRSSNETCFGALNPLAIANEDHLRSFDPRVVSMCFGD